MMLAITKPHALVVAMIDRLIPPVSMHTAIASASRPSSGICDDIDCKLSVEKNACPLENAITARMPTKITSK